MKAFARRSYAAGNARAIREIDCAAEHGDFRLKPESPALTQGFEPIPFDKIGPYKDDARATWPIREAEGVREGEQGVFEDG